MSPARAQAASADIDRDNPWPGLASFTEQDSGFFFGRERESDEFLRLVRRQTLTVLFGQSGLGKSSLLQAGVFPALRAADYLPLYLRLDHDPAAPALADQVKAALVAAFKAEGADAPAPRADETLWEYFHRKDIDIWSAKNRLLTPVLAFDQFEEIFTLGRASEAARGRSRAFLGELACLVENRAPPAVQERLDRGELDTERFQFEKPSCQVILSLREDYLPDLEGLRQEMPALVHNRMRLKRLNGAQALEIVSKPAPELVLDGVAEKIVEFVAGARGGSAERLAELDVEPPLLSVICRELNDRRRALGQATITADLVSGNRREILQDFYEHSVADLPEAMREFVEDHLLTKSGFRDNLALESALEMPGVTRPLIDTLVARRLLRVEDRLGVQRVELTHDVLADVIRVSRDNRRQRLAREVSAREARRQRWIIAGLGAVVAALVVAGIFGVRAQRRAERAAAEQARQSSRTDVILADQLFKAKRVPEALAYLVRAGRTDPANDTVGPRLLSALAGRSFAEQVGEPIASPSPVVQVAYGDGEKAGGIWSEDDRLRYWDLATGNLLVSLAPGGKLVSAAQSPDGRRAATVDAEGIARVWDLATARPITAPFPTGSVGSSVKFSPDSRWLGTWSGDGTAKIWDAVTGKLQATVRQRVAIVSLDFDPASRRMLTTSGGRDSRIWSVPEGKPVTPTIDTLSQGYSGCFSPNGKLVAICSGWSCQLFDASTGAEAGLRMVMGTGVTCDRAFFSPDGTKIATVSGDRAARIWAVPSGKPLIPPLRHGGEMDTRKAFFSSDGRLLVTHSSEGAVHVWNTVTGSEAMEPIRTGDVRDFDFDRQRGEIMTGGRDRFIRRWSLAPGAAQPLVLAERPDRISAFLSADGTAVWVLSSDRLEKRDLRTGREVAAPRLFPSVKDLGVVVYSELTSDEHFIGLRVGHDTVEVLDLRGAKIICRQIPGYGTGRRFFAFSRDSSLIAVGEGNGEVRVWDTGTAALRFETHVASGIVHSLTFFPDNRRITVSSGTARTAQVIDLAAGRVLAEPFLHGADVGHVMFSPDGHVIATDSSDRLSVHLWDATTFQPIGAPLSHRLPLIRFAFSPDGSRLLTLSLDSLRVWDAKTGAPITDSLNPGSDSTMDATFSADGALVASATRGEVRVWSAESGQMLVQPLPVDLIRPFGLNFDRSGRFVTYLTGVALNFHAWALPPVAVRHTVPGWLLQLGTAVAGGTVDSRGAFRVQDSDPLVFDGLRRQLAALPEDSPYADWGRWFLADRARRPIAPGFAITAAEAKELARSAETPGR